MKDGRKTTQIERVEIAQWTITNDYNYGAAMQQFKISYGQVIRLGQEVQARRRICLGIPAWQGQGRHWATDRDRASEARK